MSQLVPSKVRVRRPGGPGADPKAGPGGADYRSYPLPSENFDCELPEKLFSKLDLAAIVSCFTSLHDPVSVRYRLKRDYAPELVLESPEEAPPCVSKSLPFIPVPREIFFIGLEEGRKDLDCFSSRIDIDADKVLGLRVPFKSRMDVRVDFPLSPRPGSRADLLRLLTAWSLTPFFSWDDQQPEAEESGRAHLKAWLVPEAICGKCMGENAFPKPGEPVRGLWP